VARKVAKSNDHLSNILGARPDEQAEQDKLDFLTAKTKDLE